MTIIDTHTHRSSATQAVISVDPASFNPQPGLLYSVGVHPWKSGDDGIAHRLSLLENCASHNQVVAIGETGLDPLRGAPLDVQEQLMRAHIAIAIATGKPIVVHCVRTSQQVLRLWKQTGCATHTRCMIHGFRGNEHVLRPIIEAGMYVGYGCRFNAASLLATPADRLLIETDDAPYSITQVAQACADVTGTSANALMALAKANAASFFFNKTKD